MAETNETRRQLIQGSTLGAGIGLVLALFVMVNYLALRHYQRFDWTSSKLYSLSEKSLSVARGIDQDIDIVTVLNPASELYPAVNELLSGYVAANPERISKREVDTAKNLLEAQRLVEKYGIERENVVVVASADDKRVIDEFDLAEYDYSGAQMGQQPKLAEFKGEQLITSALLALVEARKPKVLFTTGHGEAQLEPADARSLSKARDLLGKDNFEIDEWSSLGETSVPEGTDLVVVAGPTTNFLPPELALLGDYLKSGGRMLMLIDPVFLPGTGQLVDLGLADWLSGYGVEIRDDIVVDPTSELPFFGPETILTDSYGSHPIVESLEQTRNRVLLPLARSVQAADDPPADYEITELVRTSEAGWGETDLATLENIAPDEADVQGPVSLGVAISFKVAVAEGASEAMDGVEAMDDVEATDSTEDGPDDATADEPEADEQTEEAPEAPEARLVVYGDLDFASDSQVSNAANGLLLLNTLNWLVKREELIDIEGRRPEQTTLTLSEAELSQIYLLVLGLLPGLAIVCGIWVHVARRR